MEVLDRQETPDGDPRHGDALASGLRLTRDVVLKLWRSENDRNIAVAVEPTVYSVDVILKAAYKFTGDYGVFLTRSADLPGALLAVFIAKDGTVSSDVAHRFANELVDQQIRANLDAQFGPLRTMIVAQAFAEGNLLDPDRDGGDYQADPRGAGHRR